MTRAPLCQIYFIDIIHALYINVNKCHARVLTKTSPSLFTN